MLRRGSHDALIGSSSGPPPSRTCVIPPEAFEVVRGLLPSLLAHSPHSHHSSPRTRTLFRARRPRRRSQAASPTPAYPSTSPRPSTSSTKDCIHASVLSTPAYVSAVERGSGSSACPSGSGAPQSPSAQPGLEALPVGSQSQAARGPAGMQPVHLLVGPALRCFPASLLHLPACRRSRSRYESQSLPQLRARCLRSLARCVPPLRGNGNMHAALQTQDKCMHIPVCSVQCASYARSSCTVANRHTIVSCTCHSHVQPQLGP